MDNGGVVIESGSIVGISKSGMEVGLADGGLEVGVDAEPVEGVVLGGGREGRHGEREGARLGELMLP